jgi:short-chain fatty acids transporter
MHTESAARSAHAGTAVRDGGLMVGIALRFTRWAERWFPDAFVFVLIAVVVVAAAALLNGASVPAVTKAFGVGFWSIIPFTLQAAIVTMGGFIIADSPPVARLVARMASWPTNGRTAVAYVAALTVTISLINWAVSLVFSALLVRAMAQRTDLRMDYRAAGAAAYLGLGGTWALGLSSVPAQMQANAASLPKALLPITGVLPFTETIFLWQSIVMAAVLVVVSVIIAYLSAPTGDNALTAQMMGVDVTTSRGVLPERQRPGEWLEYSPILTILAVALGLGWMIQEFATQNAILAISNINTYNFLLLFLGMLLHWRPKSFVDAAGRAVPGTTGILIQFPFYGAITAILVTAAGYGGATVSTKLAEFFVAISTAETFPVTMGAYTAILGFFIPSGGGKWLIEAPYVMQAANELRAHLGWALQVYNVSEALPNLINPFWMLPLIGILGIKARDIVGFTFLQLIVHVPVVFFLLWALGKTLTYVPPVVP